MWQVYCCLCQSCTKPMDRTMIANRPERYAKGNKYGELVLLWISFVANKSLSILLPHSIMRKMLLFIVRLHQGHWVITANYLKTIAAGIYLQHQKANGVFQSQITFHFSKTQYVCQFVQSSNLGCCILHVWLHKNNWKGKWTAWWAHTLIFPFISLCQRCDDMRHISKGGCGHLVAIVCDHLLVVGELVLKIFWCKSHNVGH